MYVGSDSSNSTYLHAYIYSKKCFGIKRNHILELELEQRKQFPNLFHKNHIFLNAISSSNINLLYSLRLNYFNIFVYKKLLPTLANSLCFVLTFHKRVIDIRNDRSI